MGAQFISLMIFLIILIANSPCYSHSPAEIETASLISTEGSCVEIKCKVTRDVPEGDALWFWMKDGTWDYTLKDYRGTIVYSNKNTERPISPEFERRVNFTGSQRITNRASCSVSICDLKIQDSGTYFFRYIHNYYTSEKWSTNNAVLTVKENPCPITFNPPEPVQDPSTIKLSCSTVRSCGSYLFIESVPPSGLKTSTSWYYPTTTATADFRASWQDDGREFICQTQYTTDKHLVKKIRISVQYAPRDTEAVLSSGDVTEGGSLTLTCSAKGQPPPTFTWSKNQPSPHFTGAEWTINSLQTQHSGDIWKINYVQAQHSGEYVCTAQNNHGTANSKALQIDVKYAPSVKISSSRPPYKQGQTVTLTCDVIRSNPPPFSYSWYKDEQMLKWGQTYVKNLQPEDSGFYRCSATNSVATRHSSPLQIDVQYRPRDTHIVVVGQNSSVPVGHSVVFKCVTKANPPAATYDWYWYKTHRFNPSKRTTTENTLELRSVQRTDEAYYSCRATNVIGEGDNSRDQRLEVLYPPSKPTLSMDPEVTEGQSLSITCSVDSSPVSSLTLSRTPGTSSEDLQVSNMNSLNYSVTVTSAHSGEYSCLARNSLGSDSTQRTLKVKYAPQKVTVQADPGLIIKENLTLTLRCDAQSHPPVTSVTWTRSVPGQDPKKHRGPTFTVHSVRVSDSGLYSCTAHNEIGEGTSPPAEVKVTFAPKHVEVLRWEEQASDGSRSVTLSCSSHSVPPVSLYTWYRRTEGQDLKVSENINYTVVSTQPGLYYCTAKNDISESTSDPVSLFQDGIFKFIFLALVPVVIILVALFIYRLKRKKSVQEGSVDSSSCSRVLIGVWTSAGDRTEGHRNRDIPGPSQRADIATGTSSNNVLYSTVNFPKKQAQVTTSDQYEQEESLNYASLHFKKKEKSTSAKEEKDVVYSTVKKHNQEMADVYENIDTVQKAKCAIVSDSDSSEDEVDVNYTQVNFRTKASRPSAEEEEYSLIKF